MSPKGHPADERSYGAEARQENRSRQVKNFFFALTVIIVALICLALSAGNSFGVNMNAVRDRVACANADGNPENRACQRLIKNDPDGSFPTDTPGYIP